MVDTLPAGTQLISKAITVLQHLAHRGSEGARLTDIADDLGINVSTAHRILGALEHHRMVERVPSTRNWRLGVALFVLGTNAADGSGMRKACRPSLMRLATSTGESVFLMGRSGFDAICVDRQAGTYMIESLTHNVGGVLPLGIGPGSIAILAYLDEAEIEIILAANSSRYAAYGIQLDAIRSLISETLQHGYTVTHGMTIAGVSAIAMPIRSVGGEVTAALSINMISARLTSERTSSLIDMLRQEAEHVEAQFIVNNGRNPSHFRET